MTSCKHINCKKVALYGISGQNSQYCKQHLKTDMLFQPNTICSFDSCNQFAQLGCKKQQVPQFCIKHKQDKSEYLTYKECAICQQLFIPIVEQYIDSIENTDQQSIKYRDKCQQCYDEMLEYIQKQISDKYSDILYDLSELSELQIKKMPLIGIYDQESTSVILVFVQTKSMQFDKSEENVENMQSIAQLIKKQITFIYLNTFPYKAHNKQKSQNPHIDERLETLYKIIESTPQINYCNFTVKRIYFDGFNI